MNNKTQHRAPQPAIAEHDAEEVQTPSLITPLHRQDRETSKVAGAPRAWRKLSQLEMAYQQERLGKLDSGTARDRRDAGVTYTELWGSAQTGTRDSTAVFGSGGGTGSGIPLTERQRAAIQALVGIHLHLGQRDRVIINAVCCLGHSPAEAMIHAKLSNDTRVSARLCEALDALADAINAEQKKKMQRKRSGH